MKQRTLMQPTHGRMVWSPGGAGPSPFLQNPRYQHRRRRRSNPLIRTMPMKGVPKRGIERALTIGMGTSAAFVTTELLLPAFPLPGAPWFSQTIVGAAAGLLPASDGAAAFAGAMLYSPLRYWVREIVGR